VAEHLADEQADGAARGLGGGVDAVAGSTKPFHEP